MKITHILLSLKGGGIQNFLLSLIPEQIKMGHVVSVVVTDEDDLDYSNKNKLYLESLGVNVYNIDRKVSDKVSYFKTLLKVRKTIKSINPDIVNSHGQYAHNAAAFSTLGSKIKHCCTIHNAPESWGIMAKLMNYNTPLIFCSDAALQLRGQSSKMMTAVNNGVDVELIRVSETVDLHSELGIPEDEKIIVLVGSPRPAKNYPFLIKVVKALNNTKIHFCVCGGQYKVDRKGSNNDNYIDLDQFSNCKNIHLLGLRSDIPAVLNGADVYLSCSIREGLPISALEGFFSGIPCVLSPIVQHTNIAKGISECYVPKSFDEINFINSIKLALECSKTHVQIYSERENALKVFCIDRCAQEYIDFYIKILNEGK